MQAGEHRRELVLVLSGSCRLYYPRSVGEERTTYFFFENHLLGDYSGCLTGQPSQFGIQALTDTKPVVFDEAVLRRLYDERPVYERFGRLVTEYRPLDPSAAALARGALPVAAGQRQDQDSGTHSAAFGGQLPRRDTRFPEPHPGAGGAPPDATVVAWPGAFLSFCYRWKERREEGGGFWGVRF